MKGCVSYKTILPNKVLELDINTNSPLTLASGYSGFIGLGYPIVYLL
jgi:hypothetical protein